jgi:actin-related protein
MWRPLDPAKEIDWERLTALWDYIFDSLLHVFPEDHNICMTELPDMSVASTRRLYEIMFEYFEVQSLFVANAAEMAVVALGLETGIVIDVINTTTNCFFVSPSLRCRLDLKTLSFRF